MKKALFACLTLALLIAAALPAHALNMARVRMTGGEERAQITFDFPKLVGFRAKKTDDGLELIFNTDMGSAKPLHFPKMITGFEVTRPEERKLQVAIALKPGLQFETSREGRKIIVDIFLPASQKPPPAPAAIAAKKKEDTQPVALAAATPEPVKPEVIAEEKTVEATPPVVEEKDENATQITISTVSPTKIAVFQRFHYLWIVADGQVSSAFAPEVDGRLAGFLGAPRVLKLHNGMAWRYMMPQGSHVSVRKKSLTWQIHLTETAQHKPLPVTVRVDIDRASAKARLTAMLPNAGNVLSFEDPASGDTLFIGTTSAENARVEDKRRYSDVEILPADMGFVARPLRDGVAANRLGDHVQVTAPDGIIASSDVTSSVLAFGDSAEASGDNAELLFNFPDWRKGGIDEMRRHERELLQSISAATIPDERQADMVKLARLYFANKFGHESLSILRILADENEEMSKTPDFMALRGAASAMAGHYQEALAHLSSPMLQKHREVNLWIGFAAAATEQWRKANGSFPQSNRLLLRYPDNIAIPFTIYMAESALRLGHPDTAEALLGTISSTSDELTPQLTAAIGYLRGETARQKGDIETATTLWEPVARGIDRLYHTKASLALANLQLQQEKITLQEAIDKVDSLRFAWRGDGLEVQILSNLGELKIKNGQVLDGMNDLKEAANLAESLKDDPTPLRERIREVFTNLFVGKGAAKIPPIEAVSVYNEFSHLLPPGPDKAAASLHFADELIRIDLLDKAGSILEDNIRSGGIPEDHVAEIGAKLSAIYLLDNKPALALAAIRKTADSRTEAKVREERALLQARAQSQLKQTDAAMSTLSTLRSHDAQKLKVDVLWRAQRWEAAAAAIAPLLPAPPAELDDETAQFVLNMAVATKLSGDIQKLAAVKESYGSAMETTPLASAFGVVTRVDGLATLSDRATLLGIAGEVDMFKGFLDSYKKTGADG